MSETWSVSCHRLMTTVRAWWYTLSYKICPISLSSSHDNGQSMVINPFGKKHAPSVVIVSWQRSDRGDTRQEMKHALSVVIVPLQWTEHGFKSLRHETCSIRCNNLITTAEHVIPLRYEICTVKCHHLMTTVRARWYPLRYETCSVICHQFMKTVRALWYRLRNLNMLYQLSSSHVNGQSIVLIQKVRKMFHQLSSSRDNGQS